jgi:peroxiredoxin
MGTGILKPGDAVINFTLPEAGADQPLTLSDLYARSNVALIFYRGLF